MSKGGTPVMSVTPQGDGYTVQVTGRFGGGYTCGGKTLQEAVSMVIRDKPHYDCGSKPLVFIAPPEIKAKIAEWTEQEEEG